MDASVAHMLFDIGHGAFWMIMAIFMIPITAIVLGIGSSIVKTIVKSQERRYQMRLDAQNAAVGLSDKGAQSLRDEIIRLRDTTTEHAMSMQHAIDRLEQRVAHLECKATARIDPTAPTTYQQPNQQTVGHR